MGAVYEEKKGFGEFVPQHPRNPQKDSAVCTTQELRIHLTSTNSAQQCVGYRVGTDRLSPYTLQQQWGQAGDGSYDIKFKVSQQRNRYRTIQVQPERWLPEQSGEWQDLMFCFRSMEHRRVCGCWQ